MVPEDGDAPPIRLLVPADKVCLVIGTHGAVVQDIQRKSGAGLHVDRADAKDHPGMRYVSIHGTQKQQEDAQAEVNRILGTTAGSKEYNEDSFVQDARSFVPGIGSINTMFNSSVDLETAQKMLNEQAFMYSMHMMSGMQPGMPQPGMPQPGMYHPGMSQPGMPPPGPQQSAMPPPGMQPSGLPGMYGMANQPGAGNGQGMAAEAYSAQPSAHVASQPQTSPTAAEHDEKADEDDSSPPPGFE